MLTKINKSVTDSTQYCKYFCECKTLLCTFDICSSFSMPCLWVLW